MRASRRMSRGRLPLSYPPWSMRPTRPAAGRGGVRPARHRARAISPDRARGAAPRRRRSKHRLGPRHARHGGVWALRIATVCAIFVLRDGELIEMVEQPYLAE